MRDASQKGTIFKSILFLLSLFSFFLELTKDFLVLLKNMSCKDLRVKMSESQKILQHFPPRVLPLLTGNTGAITAIRVKCPAFFSPKAKNCLGFIKSLIVKKKFFSIGNFEIGQYDPLVFPKNREMGVILL